MEIPSYFTFSQIFQWDIILIFLIVVSCMVAVSVWLIRIHYGFNHLLIAWFILLVILIAGYCHTLHEERVFREVWEKTLLGITRSFVSATETMGHAKITRTTSPNDPIYRNILDLYTKWCHDIPSVVCVFTLRRRDNELDKADWIVCCPFDANGDKKIEGPDEIGKKLYQPHTEWFDVYQAGFDGKVVLNSTIHSQKHGQFITAVAPLYDPEDPEFIEAILGIDFQIGEWSQITSQIRFTALQFQMIILILYLSILCFIATLQRTVSRLEETNRELITAKKRADVATRAKNDFLANMSHEIRTPMNALLGFTEILTQRMFLTCGQEEREESEGILEIIRKSGNDLLTIINNILDFSKIEANQLQLEFVSLSIKQVIEDVWQVEKPNITMKGLDFSVRYKEPIPELILGDPVRLQQILILLIDNAIKFTQAGKIEIYCQTLFSDNENHLHELPKKSKEPEDTSRFCADLSIIRIDVIDTGIGISPEQMDSLFQPFTQADNSSTRNFGGTGLGLSIAKRLALLMDGNITVTSTPQNGSKFSLTLQVYSPPKDDSAVLLEQRLGELNADDPALDSESETKTPETLNSDPKTEIFDAKEKPLQGVRILLVEDMPINQLVISTQLSNAGAKVEITGNGELSIKKITEDIDNGLFFDIVLMDMQMPVMDGYEATKILRLQGYNRPIIAVTAHALTGDREKTIEVGCDDYISKPVDRKVLIDTIKKHLK
jgi:signal transduction histidine kinase/CheY-like chemotaxis protein